MQKPIDFCWSGCNRFGSVFSRIHSMIDSLGSRLCDYIRELFLFSHIFKGAQAI